MKNNSLKKPPFLAKKAVKYWNYLIDRLQTIEAFHELDLLQLAVLSNAFLDYQEATAVLENEGHYYKSGTLIKLHPANQVQADALKTVRELGTGFGLNFRSREQILKAFALKPEPDALDKIV